MANIDPATEQLDGQPLIDQLLAPTEIYVKPLLELNRDIPLKAMAHITGGGLPENLPRVLPEHLHANINTHSWQWPNLFQWLQSAGNIEQSEMYRTFNCGVGMVIVVNADMAERAIDQLSNAGQRAWRIGEIVERSNTASDAPESAQVSFI